MFSSYFTPGQQATLALAITLALVAIVLHAKGKSRWALVVLTASALVLRLFSIFLDPFLNYWDECFHALVAKNMMAHPFTPMLYTEPAMPLTTSWSQQHIWLHKPPFFLCQIALSLKMFGLHPWAVRLPSALWMTALVPVTWRMACLLGQRSAAFPAALFITFSFYVQELVAGKISTDHNDAVFIAVVACSWWAFLEYLDDPRWKWVLLVGLFSACAVLTKWYVGLCIFLPWGLVLMSRRFAIRDVKAISVAVFPVVMIAGGWLAYIASHFPQEAAFEWNFKAKHFSEHIDGHSGSWSFHFDVIQELIPPFTWWIIVPALAWLVWSAKRKEHRIFLISLVVSIHVFFGFAQTKMSSYTMVLFPLYAIALGCALASIINAIIIERWCVISGAVVAAVFAGLMFNMDRIQAEHTMNNSPLADHKWRQQDLATIPVLEELARRLPDPAHQVVFNVPALYHIQFMFNTGVQATDKMPTEADVERLEAKKYQVFALQDGEPFASFPKDVVVIPDSVLSIPRIARL